MSGLRNPELHLSSHAHRPQGVGAVFILRLTEEDTKVQRGEATCSGPHSRRGAHTGLAEPEAHTLSHGT